MKSSYGLFAIREILRDYFKGHKVVIIDPEKEYENLAKLLGYGNGNQVNPLGVTYHDRAETLDILGSDKKIILTDPKYDESKNCITDKSVVPDCVSITNNYLNSILEYVLLNESKSKLVAIYASYNKENDCCEYGFKLENDTCIPVFSGFDGGLYSEIACARRSSYIDLLKAILRSGPRVCWDVPFENSFSYEWFNYEKDKCTDKP